MNLQELQVLVVLEIHHRSSLGGDTIKKDIAVGEDFMLCHPGTERQVPWTPSGLSWWSQWQGLVNETPRVSASLQQLGRGFGKEGAQGAQAYPDTSGFDWWDWNWELAAVWSSSAVNACMDWQGIWLWCAGGRPIVLFEPVTAYDCARMVLKAPALATMKTDNLAVTTTRSASLSKTALEAAGGIYIYIIIYNINYIYICISAIFFFHSIWDWSWLAFRQTCIAYVFLEFHSVVSGPILIDEYFEALRVEVPEKIMFCIYENMLTTFSVTCSNKSGPGWLSRGNYSPKEYWDATQMVSPQVKQSMAQWFIFIIHIQYIQYTHMWTQDDRSTLHWGQWNTSLCVFIYQL